MGTSKQKKIEIAERRRRVAELYLRGWSQRLIAEDVGMSVATVNRDLNHIQEEWRESALVDMDERMAQELATLKRLEDEYWNLYHESKKDQTTTRKKRKETMGENGDRQPTEIEMRETTKERFGDPAILDKISKIVDQRTRLLGLDEYDPSVKENRLDPLVEVMEETAGQIDDQFEDEDIT